jgi:hypothetical protein
LATVTPPTDNTKEGGLRKQTAGSRPVYAGFLSIMGKERDLGGRVVLKGSKRKKILRIIYNQKNPLLRINLHRLW